MQWFDSHHDYVNDYINTWNRSVRSAKIAMIALGVTLTIAGTVAIVEPWSIYDFLQAIIAVVLIIHGVGQIFSWFRTPEFFRNGAVLAIGILNALLGVLFFLLPPTFMAGTIVYLIAFLLIMTGVERFSFSRQMRFYRIPTSSMGTVTGVLNIILGVLFVFLPFTSSLMLSYLVAAYLIIGGITLVVEGVAIKRIDR